MGGGLGGGLGLDVAVVGSGFESRHGRWGLLLAGGLGLDVAVGFCLGGGSVFRRRQWAGR
jgi:hypothetical protein